MILHNEDSKFLFPPVDLVSYTCGHSDLTEYKRSALEVATMLQLAILKHSNMFAAEMDSILDFGCGCGRILSALPFGNARVCGCDVGESVSAFSKVSFPNFDIRRTNLMPPLPWDDEFFNLVYSFSVFSHLPMDVENLWLEELRRVTKIGGLLLLTVHGDWFIEATLPKNEQDFLLGDGFYFKQCHHRVGIASEMPEYYEASYHTSKYIMTKWSEYFDVLEIVRGDNPNNYLFDGLSFSNEGGVVPNFRPMGQDLVVLRRTG